MAASLQDKKPQCIIATASLQDKKPQCIIAIALTTINADEVKHVVKNNISSEIVKFKRPKVFYKYLQAKGT
ncbi:10412_t:CDS:1, partial [Cetraspora pellucida]